MFGLIGWQEHSREVCGVLHFTVQVLATASRWRKCTANNTFSMSLSRSCWTGRTTLSWSLAMVTWWCCGYKTAHITACSSNWASPSCSRRATACAWCSSSVDVHLKKPGGSFSAEENFLWGIMRNVELWYISSFKLTTDAVRTSIKPVLHFEGILVTCALVFRQVDSPVCHCISLSLAFSRFFLSCISSL